MCGVVWCYTGPEGKAAALLDPIREFGPPALFGVQSMPFPVLQSAFDPLYPPGDQNYWRADFFNALSDDAIALHVEHGSDFRRLSPGCIFIPSMGRTSCWKGRHGL